MRRPLDTLTRAPAARTASLPAPIRGWNARDAISDMEPGFALQLDNFFPGTTTVDLRRGFSAHATGMTADVESLMPYAAGATAKLVAGANGKLFDATAAGAATQIGTGYANDRWWHVNQSGHLLLFNGQDTPLKWDGTTLATNSITGVTSTSLIHPWVFKRRVFAIEKSTLSAWYLGNDAIAGAATELDFSSYCPLGGKLVWGGTWTRDGGSGSDDLCVFGTNTGEVLVYQGTDPSSAATWALVGVFRIGPPLGDRPLFKAGADLVVMTADGFLPLSMVLPVDRLGASRLALSDGIRNAVADAARMYRGNFGWQAAHYPAGNWGLFNVPVREGAETHQYVVNTTTGAWCRFTGMTANCWAVHNDLLYFGREGTVYLADTGTADAGAVITGDCRPAFHYFSPRARQKHFTMFRPVVTSDGRPEVGYALDTDFSERGVTTVLSTGTGGSPWDTSPWDTSPWAGSPQPVANWLSTTAIGYCASPHIRVATNGLRVSINSFDYLYAVGGVL